MTATSRTLALLLALLLGAPALPSCASRAPEPQWVEADVEAASLRVLWEVTRHALQREGFAVPATGFDPRTRSVTSGWRMDLHPFKGEGFRERAVVKYDPAAGERIDLSVRVEREINNNIAKPLDPAHADWKPAEDQPGRARVLLHSIRALLGDRRVLETAPRLGD